MLNILIIGNGFLGRAALEALEQEKYSCLIVGRKKYVDISANQLLIDELLGMPQNILKHSSCIQLSTHLAIQDSQRKLLVNRKFLKRS